MSDCRYMELKNRYNQVTMMEVKMVALLGACGGIKMSSISVWVQIFAHNQQAVCIC